MEQALAAIHEGAPRRSPVTLWFARHGDSVTLICAFPDELRSVIEGQLYAQYPDCRLERLPEEALAPPAGHRSWTADLRLHPDLFPCRRHPQFEDALNRTTADPLTAILTTLARERGGRVHASVQIVLRPARAGVRRRAQRCLRRLASPFFRAHHRLAHAYLALALSPHLAPRLLGPPSGASGAQAGRTGRRPP